MAREETLLTISPLFYDALSGEFMPISSETKHTLGRLAVATFNKGEEATKPPITNIFNEQYYEITYTPSWAEGTESRVGCYEPAYEGHPQTLLRHVVLTDTHRRLWIADETPRGSHDGQLRITWYGNKKSETILPVKLGADLHSARERVTEAAQEFFN